MKPLMRWAVRLYPSAWRARYGGELEVLMEDAGPRWTDILDLLRGALTMQITSLNFWKIAVGCALAGVLISGVWSLTLQDRYVSSAVLRFSTPATDHQEAWRRLRAIQETALSRNSLSTIVRQQKLYEKERTSEPLEDIIRTMLNRDIRMSPLNDTQFTVSFSNQNPIAAQAAVRALVADLVEANLKKGGTATPGTLVVLEPASLPAAPITPDRPRLIRNGLFAGLTLGVLFGTLWTVVRGRKQWSLLRIGAFAAAGMVLGITIALLVPDEYVSTAVLRTTGGDVMLPALQSTFSEDSLDQVILKYGLYPSERRSTPMPKVVEKMRAAIRAQNLPQQSALLVSFMYPDRYLAQAVTRELVARLTGTLPAEVLDPASMPQKPNSPNRSLMAAVGLFAGTLLGLAASRFKGAPLATA
jgi:hypothetical protein